MTLQYIDDQFPELSGMLQDPLLTTDDLPCLQCAERTRQLQEERQKLRSVLYMVNEDRVRLRQQLLKASNPPKDDFQEFITKTQALHYELMKKVVEKERENNERLLERLKQLGGELPEIMNKPVQTDQLSIEIRGFACSVSSIGADSHLQTPALLSPDDSHIYSPDYVNSQIFFNEPVQKPKELKKGGKPLKVRPPLKAQVMRGRKKK
jgi:hypothetical protein